MEQIAIGLSFESDWLRESGASFQNQPQGEVLAILSDTKAHIYLKFPYVLSFLPSWFVFSGG